MRTSQTRAPKWSRWLFAGIVVLSIGNAYLGYEAQRSLDEDYAALTRANEDLLLLRQVQLLLLDAETGQRGYILTQEPSYRAPFDNAIEELDSALNRLRTRLGDYTQIIYLFPPLEEAIEAKALELAETLRFAEANAFDASERITGREVEYMEEVRVASQTINDALLAEIARLGIARDRNQSRALAALAVAATASILLLWLIAALARKDSVRKQRLNELLKHRNEALDTAVRKRTLELEIANEQLDRSNRELENFAYVVSHDLQEPLRKIRAFGDRLQSSYTEDLDARAADYIRRMRSAAERMSTLLNDLLGFSRINTRGLELVDLDLNELLSTVLEDLELAIEQSSASIIADSLPVIRADATQIRQLFQNLIANGLKFQPEGSQPQLRIRCELDTDSNGTEYARISFEDNGIGFEERFLDRVFDPFQQLHGRDKFAGSGIGLAICRRVVERHGGSISASSAPGSGSTFVVRLPLKFDPSASDKSSS